MSFGCFVPGQPVIPATAFAQLSPNRWSITLSSERPIGEVVAFVTEPLDETMALGCHVASAPFDEHSWHYLGAITNACPTTVFKTRLVWSARDAVPTCIQFGVELQPAAQLAQLPPEKASAEVIEAGRRIGLDLYEFVSSFATTVTAATGNMIQLPSNVFEKWLARFNDKCRLHGLDWLSSVGN